MAEAAYYRLKSGTGQVNRDKYRSINLNTRRRDTKRLSLLLGDSRYIGKKPVKNCLNARAKMTSDKFDDERLLARKTNETKTKNGLTLNYSI